MASSSSKETVTIFPTPPEGLPKMEYRSLGRSGLKVSAISLGGWLTYGGHVHDDEAFACMKAAYDVGINFFDCAEGYSAGASEIIMGQAIKRFGWKRNDLVISTKIYWGDAFGDKPVNNIGLSRKHIIEGLNGSLSRLGLEYVDLIYAHKPDPNTPIEETVRAFNYVINAGKAFYWGTSEWDADDISTAWRIANKLGLIGPLMEQPQYNMLTRKKVEVEYAHLYEEVGLGLTIFSPLKMGLLTGKYSIGGIPKDSRLSLSTDPFIHQTLALFTDRSSTFPFSPAFTYLSIIASLVPLAKKLNISLAVLSYAWVLKNPRVSSAITGASRPSQIFESVRALDAVKLLTKEVLVEIEVILGNEGEVSRFG